MLLSQGDFSALLLPDGLAPVGLAPRLVGGQQGVLLDRATTGLCGPGGADVSAVPRAVAAAGLLLTRGPASGGQCPAAGPTW